MCHNHSHVTVGYIEQVELGPLRLTVAQATQDVKFEHDQVIAQVTVKPGALIYIENAWGGVRLNTVRSLAALLAAAFIDMDEDSDDDDGEIPPAVPAGVADDLEA